MQICSQQIEKSVGTNSKLLYIICRNFIQKGLDASAFEKKSKILPQSLKHITTTTFVNNVNAKLNNIRRSQHDG